MSNYEDIKSLIFNFSGQHNIVAVPVVYLELTGDFNTAVLLNQMVFWSDKTNRKDGYFYKTYKEWEDEIHLSEYQVRRSINKLKELDVIETELKRANGSPTLHFMVKIDNLSESILKKLKNRNLRNLRNDTEETKESITVDNTVNHNSINMCRGKAESIYESYIKNRKTEKNKTINRIQSLIKKHGEEKIIRAVERYKEETKDTEIQFIKMSSGFFTDDYIGRLIEDDYEPPKKKGQPEEEIRNYRILK